MFRRLPDAVGADVSVVIDGEPFVARTGDSVAAALLASGRVAFRRTAVLRQPRGPLCLSGACYDCLVTIDGRPGQQSCAIPVAPGMRIETFSGGAP